MEKDVLFFFSFFFFTISLLQKLSKSCDCQGQGRNSEQCFICSAGESLSLDGWGRAHHCEQFLPLKTWVPSNNPSSQQFQSTFLTNFEMKWMQSALQGVLPGAGMVRQLQPDLLSWRCTHGSPSMLCRQKSQLEPEVVGLLWVSRNPGAPL